MIVMPFNLKEKLISSYTEITKATSNTPFEPIALLINMAMGRSTSSYMVYKYDEKDSDNNSQYKS
jgi:hypothetical protein